MIAIAHLDLYGIMQKFDKTGSIKDGRWKSETKKKATTKYDQLIFKNRQKIVFYLIFFNSTVF